eukprot:1342812-Prymnesium_polylepis.1
MADGDATLDERRRRQHRRHLVEQARLILHELRQRVDHDALERVRLGARHAVPRLGRAPVHVVDRVGVVILDVPAEGREEHADVQPRHNHPAHLLRAVRQHALVEPAQVVQVPAGCRIPAHQRRLLSVHSLGLLRPLGVERRRAAAGCAGQREARAKLERVEVAAIEHLQRLVGRADNVPELPLHLGGRHLQLRQPPAPQRARLCVVRVQRRVRVRLAPLRRDFPARPRCRNRKAQRHSARCRRCGDCAQNRAARASLWAKSAGHVVRASILPGFDASASRHVRGRRLKERLEEGVLERVGLPLVLVKAEDSRRVETKLLGEAVGAEPVARGHLRERRRETAHVEAAVALIAQQDGRVVLARAAHLRPRGLRTALAARCRAGQHHQAGTRSRARTRGAFTHGPDRCRACSLPHATRCHGYIAHLAQLLAGLRWLICDHLIKGLA